jgi:hypothetical protein
MTSLKSLVDYSARILRRNDREAVLGDLIESNATVSQSLREIFGLYLRQQILLWNNWRPWLAAFGLAIPGSLLLMGLSISVSLAYQRLLAPAVIKATGHTIGVGFMLFLCNLLLLVAWAWTGGFVMSSISRLTIRISATLCFIPCFFCLERFHVRSLSRLCLLLFLVPAIYGIRRGLQIAQIKLHSALLLAIAITLLTIPTWSIKGAWLPNWALSWPSWYLVITAIRNRNHSPQEHSTWRTG